jgi:ABC-type proline/glycine betaine transport system ATPase subunit
MSMIKLEPKQYLQRYPRELSGGQQQRIGVIRALAADAPVLLMDEPFGAVDPINREMIQNEFFEMQRALNKTVIMVSHDIDEAIKLGDKIAIFRAGKLLQIDHPDTLLAHPVDDFVSNFVGQDSTLKRLLLVRPKMRRTTPVGEPGNAGGRCAGADGRARPPLCGGDLRRTRRWAMCAGATCTARPAPAATSCAVQRHGIAR